MRARDESKVWARSEGACTEHCARRRIAAGAQIAAYTAGAGAVAVAEQLTSSLTSAIRSARLLLPVNLTLLLLSHASAINVRGRDQQDSVLASNAHGRVRTKAVQTARIAASHAGNSLRGSIFMLSIFICLMLSFALAMSSSSDFFGAFGFFAFTFAGSGADAALPTVFNAMGLDSGVACAAGFGAGAWLTGWLEVGGNVAPGLVRAATGLVNWAGQPQRGSGPKV